MEPTLDLAARPGWTFLDEVEDGGSSSLQMWQQLLFCWLRLLIALNNCTARAVYARGRNQYTALIQPKHLNSEH